MTEAKTSLPTASDGLEDFNFDGVFRQLHNKAANDKIIEAQALGSEGKWDEAKLMIKELSKDSLDEHDMRNLNLILEEICRFQQYEIPSTCKPEDFISWTSVRQRPVKQLVESFTDLPQSVFFIRNETETGVLFVVGRRILSHQYRSSKIRELHCSLITADMFLGMLEDQRLREDVVVVHYRPFTNTEKLTLMNRIYKSDPGKVEIVFPFPVLKPDTHQELYCPPHGWEIDEPLADQLGQGEVLIRQYTSEFLLTLKRPDLILYDTACSTGEFLSTMKQKAAPYGRTIGQDISPFMVKFAAKRVDKIFVGDAKYPKVADSSTDVTFVRFLNSEVVKTAAAMSILVPIANTVKPRGHLIIFGHTPVLLSASDLGSLIGWKLLRCVGGGEKYGGIFQFYVLQREV